MSEYQLAKALDIQPNEIYMRRGKRAAMSEWDMDPFWQELLEWADKRLAGALAVKQELERKQRVDRHNRWEREEAIRTR